MALPKWHGLYVTLFPTSQGTKSIFITKVKSLGLCAGINPTPMWGCGPGSSVSIATELRSGRSGIESRWRRDFPPVQIGPGAHPASCKRGTGSFPGVKCGRGVLLTTHPLLVPRSWKSRAIYLYPPSGPHRACNGITLPFIYIYIYM